MKVTREASSSRRKSFHIVKFALTLMHEQAFPDWRTPDHAWRFGSSEQTTPLSDSTRANSSIFCYKQVPGLNLLGLSEIFKLSATCEGSFHLLREEFSISVRIRGLKVLTYRG